MFHSYFVVFWLWNAILSLVVSESAVAPEPVTRTRTCLGPNPPRGTTDEQCRQHTPRAPGRPRVHCAGVRRWRSRKRSTATSGASSGAGERRTSRSAAYVRSGFLLYPALACGFTLPHSRGSSTESRSGPQEHQVGSPVSVFDKRIKTLSSQWAECSLPRARCPRSQERHHIPRRSEAKPR